MFVKYHVFRETVKYIKCGKMQESLPGTDKHLKFIRILCKPNCSLGLLVYITKYLVVGILVPVGYFAVLPEILTRSARTGVVQI